MIYEIRTYRLAPGSVAEVEKRFGEAYEHRKKYSPIVAFWHTEIGPLNEIIHVWPYQDLSERARVRAESAKDPNWPPKISEFVLSMHSDILVPFPFSPQPTPGKMGPFYEMRIYTIKIGTLPDIRKGWEAKLPERMKLSPLARRRARRSGRSEPLYSYLGLHEPRPAGKGPRHGPPDRRVAAGGRRRPPADPGEQNHDAIRFFADAVAGERNFRERIFLKRQTAVRKRDHGLSWGREFLRSSSGF